VGVFTRHLWYLHEVTVGLSFLDSNVGTQEKMQMVSNVHDMMNAHHSDWIQSSLIQISH